MNTLFKYAANDLLARSKLPAVLQALIHATELAHLEKLPANVQRSINDAFDATVAVYMVTLPRIAHEEVEDED